MVVFDTYAWIEYFAGSEKGETARALVDGEEEILTPSVCLAEIKLKYLKEKRGFEERISFVVSRSNIVSLDKEIALKCAEVKAEHGLYIIDAVIYATAQLFKTGLITGDKHFNGLKEVTML